MSTVVKKSSTKLKCVSIFIPIESNEIPENSTGIAQAKTVEEFGRFSRDEIYQYAAKTLNIKKHSKSTKLVIIGAILEYLAIPIEPEIILTEKQLILKEKRIVNGKRLAAFNAEQRRLNAELNELD